MHIFGKEFYNGQRDHPIYPLEIYFEDEDLRSFNLEPPSVDELIKIFTTACKISRLNECFISFKNAMYDMGIDEAKHISGSNALFRTVTWLGSFKDCVSTFGCIPKGAFAFKTRETNMCKPEKYKKDGIADAYSIGIVNDNIVSQLDVDDWDTFGLWKELSYSPAVDLYLRREE